KYAEADLKKTCDRLQKVDAARQMLLKNVSTAVDKANKRFAGDLHDDALQKLPAAGLQLQRLHDPNGDSTEVLTEAQFLLAQTEEALRRLLFEVRPPALEVPGGFAETIRERIRMLRSLTGAEVEVDLDLPEELSYEFRSLLFRQMAEAIANIEQDAAATRIRGSFVVRQEGARASRPGGATDRSGLRARPRPRARRFPADGRNGGGCGRRHQAAAAGRQAHLPDPRGQRRRALRGARGGRERFHPQVTSRPGRRRRDPQGRRRRDPVHAAQHRPAAEQPPRGGGAARAADGARERGAAPDGGRNVKPGDRQPARYQLHHGADS